MVETRSPKESQAREGAAKDTIFIIHDDGTTEVFLKEREYKTPVLSNEQLHDMLEKLARKKNNSNNVKNQEKH